jgi:dipeptidyl-peptidase-4
MLRYRPLFALLALSFIPAAPSVRGQGTAADYERASKLLDLVQKKVFKDRVHPHWLADKLRFWYRNDLPGEAREFILVDAAKGERRLAFDHARLADALAKTTGEPQRGTHLSIDDLDFSPDGRWLHFRAGAKYWKCDLNSYVLTKDQTPAVTPPEEKQGATTPPRRRRGERPRIASPDGKWTVVVKDHNLYLREKETGTESALSRDGNADDGYSERIFWSPNGKKLVALRTKKGQEHKVYLLESSPRDQLQPKLHVLDYLKPGDRIPITKPHLFDVNTRQEIPFTDKLFPNPWSIEDVRWAPDSRYFTFVYNQRGHQVLRVIAVDAESGTARTLIDEQSKTFLDYNSKFFLYFLDSTNEIIWMSERDGWNHLYLYDAVTGQVKNQITKGPWVVRGVDRVDDKARQIWFRAGGIHPGQDPYYVHYCRTNFDGSGLVCLTQGDGTHQITYSPDRRFYIDNYSRVDLPPVTELRRTTDGQLICELERADISALVQTGWKAPERFVAKGRDGQTDIYGVLFRPTNLDVHKKYPIIEQIYAGPQGASVPKAFQPFFYPQQLAELGFIVVQVDGMGTNYRSKAFHDVCWKNLGDAGLPDRIRWIKAAAAKYPYMDLSRVGIYGGSAGGQNALRAVLAYPDFYKAASANCGCHDNRMDKIWWNELWMGWPVGPHYAEQSNVTNAHKLQGKLLLIVGELDRNVDPASTMQVVNALIKAGKDFELLVVPGAGHGTPGGYARRREQDFFVRHLLGVEPPDRNTSKKEALPSTDAVFKRTSFEKPVKASVRRPYAYLFPASWTKAIEDLQRRGIAVEELREDIEVDLEIYRIAKVIQKSNSPKPDRIAVQASLRKEARRIAAGTVLVRMNQPKRALAADLLELQAEDGLWARNVFTNAVREGTDYPVWRLPHEAPLLSAPVRPLPEKRTFHKRIDLDMLLGKKEMPNLSGTPMADITWLDAGEHFLQRKEGQLWKVHAVSGRAQPQPVPDEAKIEAALASLPTIDRKAARQIARRAVDEAPDGKKGRVFQHGDDLYYYFLDGSKAVRLTHSVGAKELVSLSPNEQYVAYVRANNLYVADIATQTERALTNDGSALVSNGKMDWVYWEEIGNRQGKAYWWSPDSSHLAFVRYDDTPVHTFAVLDTLPRRQRVELTPYPKAGDPIPTVKLGIVPTAGGPVAFVDLSDYCEGAMILTRAGWLPNSEKVYFYIQDREQTWLDFCTAPRTGGSPTRLFRERTRAWVNDPGPPYFLKDGSFLLASERSGWRHLYHFDAEGKLKRAVTSGPWEVRNLHLVDEPSGWVYFSGTKDQPIGLDLYRVKVTGGEPQRLTAGPGQHRALINPQARLFADYHNSHTSPPTVRLYRTDGTLVRTLDTNPVYAREEYDWGEHKLFQISAPDGFRIEASLVKPPDFDASRRYPVWFTTYGGPHAPVVQDAWQKGRLREQGLANLGFLVFQVDPRSASGKGACSTWTAYRQLGVQELADIETAIRWLTAHSFVDAERIGMTGHSYGGFLTAYALTHSKLFAAGVAGAPVTDWHNYDAFYTERYMNTPQENPEGYQRTSVVAAARQLHGRLLLIHGIRDDNVHVQNTLQLVNALQRADKDFELMIYPNDRHGIRGRHYQRLVIDFMRRTLKPTSGAAAEQPKASLPVAVPPTGATPPAGR